MMVLPATKSKPPTKSPQSPPRSVEALGDFPDGLPFSHPFMAEGMGHWPSEWNGCDDMIY